MNHSNSDLLIDFIKYCFIVIEFKIEMARFNNHNNNRLPIPAKNAERERSRVRCLRNAFQTLQQCLPSVPPNTKLSKLDILILATNYIQILMQTLNNNNNNHYDSENNGNNIHEECNIYHHSIDFIQSTATLSSSSTLIEEMATTTFYTIENSSNQSLSKVYRPIKVKFSFCFFGLHFVDFFFFYRLKTSID